MRNMHAWILGVALVGALNAPMLFADDREHHPRAARELVSQTQGDVQKAAQFAEVGGKDRERFENALKSLSELDRSFSKDRYNEDRLNKAIEDIQNIEDHNTIQSSDRDVLHQDLVELRTLRSEHKN